MKEDDWTNYDLDLSVVPLEWDGSRGVQGALCIDLNNEVDDCCKCFKKKGKGKIIFDPRDIFNKKGQKKMRKYLIPKGEVLEIPVTFVNSTVN